MKKSFICLFLLILLIPAFNLDLDDLQGLWRGDKALGDVIINSDGSGKIIFEGDVDLSMKIAVHLEAGRYVISQAEENQIAFYLAFNPFLKRELSYEEARILSEKARPMRWELTLSADGKILQGTKYTTSWTWNGEDFLINNDYSRESSWNRLKKRLIPPEITIRKGPTT